MPISSACAASGSGNIKAEKIPAAVTPVRNDARVVVVVVVAFADGIVDLPIVAEAAGAPAVIAGVLRRMAEVEQRLCGGCSALTELKQQIVATTTQTAQYHGETLFFCNDLVSRERWPLVIVVVRIVGFISRRVTDGVE
jgi:hypothetical protein